MEAETSQFESSEMLAAYLASTPLLDESWRLCRDAAPQSFAVRRSGKVGYLAFSGVQSVDCSEETCRKLVELDAYAKGVFGGFCGRDGDGEPIMVHGGLLQIFSMFYRTQNFQDKKWSWLGASWVSPPAITLNYSPSPLSSEKVHVLLNECKSIVCTGHSLGGAVASLSALWLLSTFQAASPSTQVLCITFGSPMLGNDSFSQAILQERWGGNFCHIVGQHDIVPRVLFAPPAPIMEELRVLFQFWHLSLASPPLTQLASQLSYDDIVELFKLVITCAKKRCNGVQDQEGSSFSPFGGYLFCTDNGAICLDNRDAIVKLLYLLMLKGSPLSYIEDHLKYGDYVSQVSRNYLCRRSLTDVGFSESSSEAGIALALHSSGINSQEAIYRPAMNCLAEARFKGCRRNLNNAKMSPLLAQKKPLQAQIEWYKKSCDESDDQMGYYDAFKRRSTTKRWSKVDLNCIKLGKFWDKMLHMLEMNELTHDFHKLPKYVNAAHSYKLLIEPLEIAQYYRTGMHKKKGHYIEHGREKRFKIFDKWWRDRTVGDEESNPRSRFASLTQDSCFWARVEEARDYVLQITSEWDSGRKSALMEKIDEFEQYAQGMIQRKEVSVDVLAKNSSYSKFREEWEEQRSRLVSDMCIEGENSYLVRFS